MAYKVIILYRLYMPSYFLGTFTEYPQNKGATQKIFLEFGLFFFYRNNNRQQPENCNRLLFFL